MRQYLLACAALLGMALSSSAQDRIVIQQPSGTRLPISGFVEDYTGREISVRLKPDDPVRKYPRSDVVEVVTDFMPRHDRARKLFAAGKIADAKKEYVGAYEDENRSWVRREILAGQVRCALWLGDYDSAAARFFAILESDPETFHVNLAPLNWSDDQPSANLRNDALKWISITNPPWMRLVGASWLLNTSDLFADADQQMKRLAREADVRVQRLAQMQLWRLKLHGAEPLDLDEIRHWEQFVEGIPVELRGGAYFVIGQAWKQRKEYERASRAFLWLPLVFDSDRWLSAHACFEAADALELQGDFAQAFSLYSEVVFRYGDTRWGMAAEAAWKRLRPPKDAKQ